MKPKRLPELYENDIARFLSKVDKKGVDGCWPWLGAIDTSYGRGKFIIERVHENLKRTLQAPRIAYALHYECDPYPDSVLHNCNNANCVNPRHLRLGTAKDNSADSIEAGTQVCGEDVHLAKLTNASVRGIKIALMNAISVEDLARDYKVDSRAIRRIREGATWKHIEVPGFLPFQWKRLSEIDVRKIKIALVKGEFLQNEIAQQYGVCFSTVSHIRCGKTWKHVKVPGFKPSTRRTS